MKAAEDEERFVFVGDMYTGNFPHVAEMLDLQLTRYPKKTRILTLLTSGPPILKRIAKHLFVWVTKGTAESNFEQILETREACFGLFSCHVVPANHR